MVKSYIEGTLDGPYRIYYAKGTIQEEGEYRAGQRVGLWKRYYSDGSLKCSGYYGYGANGKRYSNGWTYSEKNDEKRVTLSLAKWPTSHRPC